MRNKVLFTFLGLGLALSACTGANDPVATSLEQSVAVPPSQAVALATGPQVHVGPAQAVASLPGELGAVASVQSHDYVNGFRQDISLQGGSLKTVKNSITVLARTSGQPTLDEAVPLWKPSEAGIRSELGQQFPHIAMQVAERDSSNVYGPYGMALGRSGDTRCLYVWQWIDQNRLPPEAGVAGPVSVRVRLCRSDMSFDAMAALIDRLSIRRDGSSQVASAGANDVVSGPSSADEAKAPKRKRIHHPSRVARHTTPTSEPVVAAVSAVPLAPAPVPLSTDLPAQAYLGPKAGTNATASR